MPKLGTAVVLAALTTTAAADPQVRFGMTTGANRNTPEVAEVGPMIAAGLTHGVFTGEVNYGYLSFMDPDTEIHRAGVALRASVATWGSPRYWKQLFTEVGASKRWGRWARGDNNIDAVESSQNEVHVGVGLQLDRKWQFGVRFGAARLDPMLASGGVACRGMCTAAAVVMPDSSGLAASVMLEWMFLFDGRGFR